MPIGILSDAKNKFCGGCLEKRPIAEFRRRRRGGEDRHAACNSCRNRKQRELYALQRAKTKNELVAAAMKKVKRATYSSQVEFVISSLINALGGVENFVEESLRHFNGSPPGRRGDFLLAVVRSIELNERVEVDPDELSDAELEEAFAQQVAELLESQPDVAASVLRAQGWEVSPPAAIAQ